MTHSVQTLLQWLRDDGFTAETMAAKLFGRWPSGCPLSRSPQKDLAALGADKSANNAYAFACPHAVRVAPDDPYPKAVAADLAGTVCCRRFPVQ